jgi:mannose-6-phosphate isomerase
MSAAPLVLPSNDVARFYLGGAAIGALRGVAPAGDRVPEEWIASTTEALGEPGVGLSPLADGTLLRDAVAADSVAWLGERHVVRHGPDPQLLVKLLDAGERLPVHAHPDGPFAREHLGTRFGKTEAWIVVAGQGSVWAGWREPIAADTLADWVARQDVGAMLAALHELPVGPGDAVFVPAGVAHAIGQGLLIVELQEPSDLSILLERPGDVDAATATLELGDAVALDSVSRAALDPQRLRGTSTPGTRLLPAAADAFFRASWLRADDAPLQLPAGFGVLVVVDGTLAIQAPDGPALVAARGDNVVIPYAAGPVRVTGGGQAIWCRAPDEDAPTASGR